ncbi:spondin domain-containing protein [Sabulilitoribacter multivorans]|uniref:Spondin domain-containing protein n=1 Tax=Flaviramulus multivorans TaxID=1304750 RepID=A0ABS9IHN9_9FLAO|nr:spondin domain-containing protein [Flaviramulus multivorans]MCF7560274.1 spondin domain-containing protein [Flaviramulus multivorans]
MKKITQLLCLITLTISSFTYSQSTANYTIEFNSIWESVSDNPTMGQSTIDLPASAHWSPLAVATHKTVNTFLMMGGTASLGIENIAETGSTTAFVNIVNTSSDADQVIVGSSLGTAKGSIFINNLVVSEDFPLVTLASMIAPSPDWFIGVNGIDLRSGNPSINNGWKDTFTIDLFPYDAGTEDGSSYSLSNPATNPQGVVTSLVNVTPFNSNKIGTLTFTYNSSTLSNNNNAFETIKIYPNPTNGNITISNIKNIELSTVQVYNVLGRLIKEISLKNGLNKVNLDLTSLNQGVYLLSLNDSNGRSKTQKLVIN